MHVYNFDDEILTVQIMRNQLLQCLTGENPLHHKTIMQSQHIVCTGLGGGGFSSQKVQPYPKKKICQYI